MWDALRHEVPLRYTYTRSGEVRDTHNAAKRSQLDKDEVRKQERHFEKTKRQYGVILALVLLWLLSQKCRAHRDRLGYCTTSSNSISSSSTKIFAFNYLGLRRATGDWRERNLVSFYTYSNSRKWSVDTASTT